MYFFVKKVFYLEKIKKGSLTSQSKVLLVAKAKCLLKKHDGAVIEMPFLFQITLQKALLTSAVQKNTVPTHY